MPEYTIWRKFILWLDTLFMSGVSHIEIIIHIALSLRAVTCYVLNYFCMAELLQHFVKKNTINYLRNFRQNVMMYSNAPFIKKEC